MTEIDLLISDANEVLTLAGGPAPRTGAAMGELGIVRGGSVAIRDGRVLEVGPAAALAERYQPRETIDARGKTVLPGFVDPHTHPAWATTREDEFLMRMAGKGYMEIAAAGGGIHASVRKLRELSQEELTRRTIERMAGFLPLGTTTVEAKSGYGLTTADELKSLRAIAAAARELPIDVVPTFLGAHEIPHEFREQAGGRERFVKLVTDEMIPAVVEEGLALFNDVFCEEGVFTPEETRTVLEAGKAAGLRAKVHADELAASGGSRVAAEVGAISADHLVMTDRESARAMAAAGTVAVLLPATTFHLGKTRFAPARMFVEEGVAVALATDFNPGTAMTRSMQLVLSLAVIRLKLTCAEAICAATHNAACAIGLAEELGRLEPGLKADLVVHGVSNHEVLPYHLGESHAELVVKDGLVAWRKR